MRKKKEDKYTEDFLSDFKKDPQGTLTSLGEHKLPPVISDLAEPSVSNSLFTPEQIAEIQSYVSDGNMKVYNALLEQDAAKKNTPPPKPSASYVPMNTYHAQNDQIITAPEFHTPIKSVPYSAMAPNSGSHLPYAGVAPNTSSAVVTNPSLAVPSTIEERLAKFREDLDQVFFEKIWN